MRVPGAAVELFVERVPGAVVELIVERRTRSDGWAPNRIGGLLDATAVEQEKKMRLPVDTDAGGSLHNPSASTTRSTNDGASPSSATVRAARLMVAGRVATCTSDG